MAYNNLSSFKNLLSYEAISQALFETYESLYDIDVETSAYQCYHESKSYSALKIDSRGADFFADTLSNIQRTVYPEDREYVEKMFRKETMLAVLEKERYYSFVYRLMIDGDAVYHKIRATLESVGNRKHILLGVRNVDETIRQEKRHTQTLSSMHQKEKNHMEAILASAAGYLEVNLTQDIVLEQSPHLPSGNVATAPILPAFPMPRSYQELNRWLCEHQIVENNRQYEQISDRSYLLTCFERGEKRASVSFSARTSDGGAQPCKEVFYLYRDNASGDVFSFCVIYDLTEQQRKEKELQELETALQMSRIRNFTSQMQPHFLYNALGSIQEIVLEDPEYASELIGDFTVHLRSCIRAMANDKPLPFEQELANIRAYVNIEKMRFGKKLRMVYDIAEKDFAILPLSVQPLVENAIRHGIYQRGAKGGTVTVRTRSERQAWIVEVEDDGVGFDPALHQGDMASGKKDSTGLKNILFRLDKVMHATVTVQSAVGVGTKVVISIPKGAAEE